MKEQFYNKDAHFLAEFLGTDLEQGLSARKSKDLFEKHGYNKLAEAEKDSALTIFFRQFNDFITIVLMISTLVSALLGEVVDSIAILVIIVMNAVMGFIQEYRAENPWKLSNS